MTGVLAAGAELPAPAEVTGPVLGYVFDGAAAGLRRVIGIPGAALLTEPVPLGTPLAGAVSAWPARVLAISAADRQVKWLEFSQGTARWGSIAGLAAGPDEIVLSPAGRAAAVLYRSAAKVAVVSGLPDAPQVAREVEIAGTPVSMAVNDEGALLAIGYESSVLLRSRSGEARWLLTLGRPAALAFSYGGSDLLLADATNQAVYWVRQVNGVGAVTRLAGERDGIADPAGLAFSPGDQRALVANAGAGTLTVIDLAAGTVTRTACRTKPTGLYPLGAGVYSFRAPAANEPLWLYEARSAKPRVFFAPPELKPSVATVSERSGQ